MLSKEERKARNKRRYDRIIARDSQVEDSKKSWPLGKDKITKSGKKKERIRHEF